MSDTPRAGTRVHRCVRRTAVPVLAGLLAGLLVGLLWTAGPATASPAASASAPSGAEARSARYEQLVLTRISRVRARSDLRPVLVLRCVDVVAEKRVARPIRPARAARVDARRLRRTCDRTLELEATRTGTPRSAVRGLLRQRSTRQALHDPAVTSVGVAATRTRGRGWRVTLLLAGGSGPGTTSGGAVQDGTTRGPAIDDPAAQHPATTDPTTEDPATAMDELELAVLEETNRRRAEHGLPPLQPSSCAADFAGEHSAAMARSGSFAHADLADLRGRCGGGSLAENIAMGSGAALDARSLVQLWMDSPGHRANILAPGLTHLGVGIALAHGSGAWYATQDFLGGA